MSQLKIEVVYGLPLAQDITPLVVPAGTTVAHAIELSGVQTRHTEIDVRRDGVAVYGRRVSLEAVLKDNDRVEILRPLQADPKEARRRRAANRGLKGRSNQAD